MDMDKPRKYNRPEVLKFLRSNPILSLAACYQGKPVASVVTFAIEDDFTILFATHGDSVKAKALREQPTISYSSWKLNEILVQGGGEATEVTGDAMSLALNKILKAMDQLENFWPPILRITGEPYTVFSVRPTWLRALDLSDPSYDGIGQPFSEFEFPAPPQA